MHYFRIISVLLVSKRFLHQLQVSVHCIVEFLFLVLLCSCGTSHLCREVFADVCYFFMLASRQF